MLTDNALYCVTLVVGDWSRDGHEKTDTISIESNLSPKDIEKAYKKGTKKIGVDLSKTIVADYECNVMSSADVAKFVAAGFDLQEFLGAYYEINEDGSLELGVDEFVDLYLFVVKTGNADFISKRIEPYSNINIGGYGLYY